MTTALIGSSLARPGSIQPAVSAPKPSVQPYGDFIPIDRTDEYWVSVWSFLRARSAGTARLQVKEYDDSDVLLATTEFAALTAAETKWTRHDLHFGPVAVTGRTAWHANTRWIKVLAFADGTPNMTWEVDAWQVERGPHPTAYAPRPQELVNGQIDRAEIAPLAVQAPQLDNLAVTAAKVAALAITETKIADDAISTPKLQANAITAVKIGADAVTAAKIQAGAVDADKIAANAVTAVKIQAGAIETDKLAALAVNADKIAAGAIEATKIAANAIVTGKIASGVSATGMLVISAVDGTTVILDGSSNMFKIAMTGTMSHTQAAATGGQLTLDLTSLGTLPTTPAHLCYVSEGNTTGSHQHGFRFMETADVFVSGSSGGAVNQRTRTMNWTATMMLVLAAGIARVVMEVQNATAVSKTAYGRYYVLKEAAL